MTVPATRSHPPLRLVLAGFAACAGVTLAGCGGAKGPELTPVSGKVLLKGKAAEHATVVLHPVNPATPDQPKPHGTVGPDGTFALTTFATGDGAPPGEYKVTVEQWIASPRPDEPATNRLPSKYSKVATSGLTATIAAGKTELPAIEITR